ncbi:serine/threonine-protein kinase [Actinoallomurus purpureus]|uniref:protein kinase domain-containing protein n=1 Tax=Actinoallomurus purpureus TaxID=478114 RepID=UPI002093A7DA|nr:serine/threonine-protein kinase [Actinoallomurus purpureus]MCO6006612.1 serine/threonine-protein kinase [Actinoallomurus purpureus]
MADIEGPSETRREEFGTRRDTAPSQHDAPGATRRDGGSPGPSLVRLPADLGDRLSVLGELPAQGAESDLLHVRDHAGTELVVKIFRRGFTADRSVWQKLPTLDSPHVVRILETGHAEGRDYEVIEYVPAGNLRVLGAQLPPALVAEVVAQLAGGLDRLHAAGIVHRDLKPENVLVRGTTPLRLAITDFGLSRVIEQSVVFASSSRTLAYAAPESLSGQVSPARDWWSLGIIARELLTGRTPFAGMSETAVVDHLATRTIDCDDIADPRMRLLCQGLLTRDPRKRWSGDEVGQWLGGENPAVATPAPPSASPLSAGASSGALAFGGRTYTDRSELARALMADWEPAARYFFGTMYTPVGPSEAWQALRGWLNGFGDDSESRIRLIDEHLTGDRPPDVKLLYLLRWLDPTLDPHFLGLRLLPEDLPVLAAIVDDEHHPDHHTAARAARALWEHRLLPVLAGFSGTDELTAIDHRWQGLVTSWNRQAEWLRSQLPRSANRLSDAGAAGLDEPPVILVTLLALAGHPDEAQRSLAVAADRARDSVREPVPWFAWLSDQAGDDLLRLFAVIRTAPDAVLEVEATARRHYEAEQRSAEGRGHWEERERHRLSGRRAAMIRAVLWTLPLAVLWIGGGRVILSIVRLASSERGGQAVDTSAFTLPFLLIGAIAWVVDTGSEVFLASKLGADYMSSTPWSPLAKIFGSTSRALSGASQAVSRRSRRTGNRGCGVAVLLCVLPLLMLLILIPALVAVSWLLWLAVLVMVPLAHIVVTAVRMQRWRQAHETAREQAVGGRL